MDWFTDHKLPVGRWIAWLVDLLNDHAAGFFRFVSDTLGGVIDWLSDILLWLNPFVLILILVAIAYAARRRWTVALGTALGLLLILNLGYWQATVQTLTLVVFATIVCLLIGIPIGVLASRRAWIYPTIQPVLDLMQTIPTFVYLIPTLILFGLGVVPGLISTVIFALPAPIRLTYLGLKGVPRELKEAGQAFGATPGQLLWRVELPFALPSIMAGLTQCIMLSLSMVVIAALVGADGLGKPVVRALNTVNIGMGFEAGLAIVILAIILDRTLKLGEPPGRH